MEQITSTAIEVEKLGIAGVLVVCLGVAIWAVWFLYNQSKDCEKARLQDANERSEMNRELGELSTTVKQLEKIHLEHLLALIPARDDGNTTQG